MNRREFVKKGTLLVGAAMASGLPVPKKGWSATGIDWSRHPTPEISSNEDFYVTSKGFFHPRVNLDSWSLEVSGLVANPKKFDLKSLVSFGEQKKVIGLECVGNKIGGSSLDSALWRGVSFDKLLEAVKPRSNVVDVVMHGADGYSDSIRLDWLKANYALLAHQMNGQDLPRAHGYPLRLLAPGIYGMKNLKWIEGIEFVDYDYKGYWQTRGWSDDAFVKPHARIDTPRPAQEIPRGVVQVAGVAFTGNQGVSKVEVSFDGGRSWAPAHLKEPRSPYSWILWAYPWEAPKGRYAVSARCVDGRGRQQPKGPKGQAPDHAEGWHTVEVEVF
jgi:DMSO/TMAO reductase YedYZ molybdopterin-dependent catalytic subunit